MSEQPIPSEWAAKIYDMLVEECGAPPSSKEDFIRQQGEGCREFRFQGGLGFGGKFYVSDCDWRVDCYTEDLTDVRRRQMHMANIRLDNMRGGMQRAQELAQLRQQLAEATRERDEYKAFLNAYSEWTKTEPETFAEHHASTALGTLYKTLTKDTP